MAQTTQGEVGAVVSLWRYPVKSMIGEELQTAHVTAHGLLGDRAYALIDRTDGKVATAKNPGKWPTLFACRATFLEPPHSGGASAAGPHHAPRGQDCRRFPQHSRVRSLSLPRRTGR
jgi:hypothetical protein